MSDQICNSLTEDQHTPSQALDDPWIGTPHFATLEEMVSACPSPPQQLTQPTPSTELEIINTTTRRGDPEFYSADADTISRGLVSTQRLTSSPKGQIFVGCVPQILTDRQKNLQYNTPEDTEAAMRGMLASLRYKISAWINLLKGETKSIDEVCPQGMCVLEKHAQEGWHVHWAIKLGKSFSMSISRFENLMTTVLGTIFGKWSYFQLGSCWPQLEQYYVKNVAPKGSADASIAFFPEKTMKQVAQELVLRKEHKKNIYSEKNQTTYEAYQQGTLASLILKEGVYDIVKAAQLVQSCRIMAAFEELTPALKQHIEHTEVWFIFGPSRTGKTYAAMNKFCYEEIGNMASNKLRILRQAAAELQAGFLNGYEGQEVIVIDEVPQYWAEAHRTLKVIQTWMDNYEGTINVKGGVVQKRVWRWVLISNYPPDQVLSTIPKDSGFNQIKTSNIDMIGTYEPLGMRVTNNGQNPERCLHIVNEAGHNPSTGFSTECQTWGWFQKEAVGEVRKFNE